MREIACILRKLQPKWRMTPKGQGEYFMARIIVSTYSGLPNATKLPCFYEGLIDALVREGNDVLLILTNGLIIDIWENNITSPDIDKTRLDRAIVDFAPELVITFNNSMYENIPRLVDCPIAIWTSDSPSMLADKENLKRHIKRYHLISPTDTEDFIQGYKDYFGASDSQISVVYFASDFKAETIPQDKNISFIGTHFSHSRSLERILKQHVRGAEAIRRDFKLFLDAYKKNVWKSPATVSRELGFKHRFFIDFSHAEILNIISGNQRVQTLAAVSDLGLHLYGSEKWRDVSEFSVDLALAYDPVHVSSVKENQDIYNSSKIALNITHAQAGKAFSWRVRDIMACNAALVSDYREDIVTHFGKYVKIPMYDNPYDARALCQKVLGDAVWRREIVQGSQLAIEEGHRFRHRLKDCEQILGVNLFPGAKGSLVWLDLKDFRKSILENFVRGGLSRQQTAFLFKDYLGTFCIRLIPLTLIPYAVNLAKSWGIKGSPAILRNLRDKLGLDKPARDA